MSTLQESRLMNLRRLDPGKSWREQDLASNRRPGKTVCVQRYGGFGDMLQMSSILPGLKEKGYHVTVNTTPEGYNVVKHDPHIDEFFLQNHNQVPNAELGYYWEALSKGFDKFIMLSESLEVSLLAAPEGRAASWHPDFRRMVMGTVDYIEAAHAIAEVPLPPRVRFYPSPTETAWANGYKNSLGKGSFVILWALSGSSVHKTWPHMDIIFARLMMTYDHVKIITCGGELDQVLEIGWEKEPRVITKSAVWDIRTTLAFAEVADLVIGPETGVLNSVSMRDTPKILMLSHSSRQNIGKNWKNLVSLTPTATPCYPCHILHRGFDLCNRDEITGTALCAARISPDAMWLEITNIIGK